MKTRSEIQEQLDTVRKARKHFKKKLAEAEDMRAAARKLSETIAKIGEPDYKDDASIERLAVVKVKLELCEKALAKREDEIAIMSNGEAREVSAGIADFVENRFLEALHERSRAVAQIFMAFCRRKELAEELAYKTDAVLLPLMKMDGCKHGWRSARDSQDLTRVIVCLGEMEEILIEALKDRPNLIKFIDVDITTPAKGGNVAAPQPAVPALEATATA